jgi:hypothetical protein
MKDQIFPAITELLHSVLIPAIGSAVQKLIISDKYTMPFNLKISRPVDRCFTVNMALDLSNYKFHATT